VRDPGTAAVLSAVIPGLGQIYNGQILWAVVWFIIAPGLWIGTGGLPIAQLVLPVVKPEAYLPVHWDGLWGAFNAGVPQPYSDPALENFLAQSQVRLVRPVQYMDKWRLDRDSVRPIDNGAVKHALGFK